MRNDPVNLVGQQEQDSPCWWRRLGAGGRQFDGARRRRERVETAPWVDAIRAMDEALAKGDVRGALSAREDARLAALSSDGWEGLVLVGDATLRLAQNSGLRVAMEPAARRAYVFALDRARRQESLEGVVRVTEALVALGDLDMARKGCGIAGALAASARRRMRGSGSVPWRTG